MLVFGSTIAYLYDNYDTKVSKESYKQPKWLIFGPNDYF
jgi:hypothetical protein